LECTNKLDRDLQEEEKMINILSKLCSIRNAKENIEKSKGGQECWGGGWLQRNDSHVNCIETSGDFNLFFFKDRR
jgi:hypothetical protein